MAITLCVLLSAHVGQEESLERYEDEVLALLADHGGRVIVRLRAIEGRLAEVQVLEFVSETGLASFQADPRRTALSDLREVSIASTTVLRAEPIR